MARKKQDYVKLPQLVIVKAKGLLPMRYQMSELANDVGTTEHDIYRWITHGAPHEYDNQNHIWVIGTEFAEWVEEQRVKGKKRKRMAENEAYCFRCNEPVILENVEIIPIQGKLIHLRGTCPHCKRPVFRGGRISRDAVVEESIQSSIIHP